MPQGWASWTGSGTLSRLSRHPRSPTLSLIKPLFLLVLLSPLALLAAAWMALSDEPLVVRQVALTHQDVARAKAVLQRNDPRRLPAGAQRIVELSAQDLDLAANYLLQGVADGRARFALSQGRLGVQLTLRIPRLPLRPYLNLEGALESRDDHPELTALRLGRLDLPGPLAGWLARRLIAASLDEVRLASATELVKSLQLSPDRLRLSYRWHPALIDQARDTLLTRTDQAAMRVYLNGLVDLQAQGIGRNGALVDLLEPLFAIALARADQGDPIGENRALLTVLGAWATRRDIGRLVPGSLPRPQAFRLKLDGRRDFAQHFLASAALAARGDGTLADAVGLFKELSDTDQGSGFSFADLAADRAGTRFGELATRSPEDARRLQQRLAAGISDADIMPPAKDLPEQLQADAFRQRFGQVGSPAYQGLMAEIERRIDACALYRD